MTPERPTPVSRRTIAALAIAAQLALVLAGLGLAGEALAEGSQSPVPGGPAASAAASVSIIDRTFQPADVTIHVGEAVTWTVTKAIGEPHSVTSGTPADTSPGAAFDSGIVLKQARDSYSHTFDTAGTFAYFCAVHPDTMRGTVTVLSSGEGGATGGGGEAGVDTTAKITAALILAVALIVLLGWARLYRRLNPGP